MAPPLSSDLPLSSELRNIFAHATDLASEAERPVLSVHLLLALYSVNNRAAAFLQEHHFPDPGQEAATKARRAKEHPGTVERIWARSQRLAQRAQSERVTSMHLLAAMLRDSTSSAYRMLEDGGINVSGIRTRVMSYATRSCRLTRHQIAQQGLAPPARPEARPRQDTPSAIGFHPSLSGPGERTRSYLDRRLRERNRARLEELSSPVHPALRESWLRTTPSGGLPAIDGDRARATRDLREDSSPASGLRSGRRPRTGEFTPLQERSSPADHSDDEITLERGRPPRARLERQDERAPEVGEREVTDPPKSLKERFAELKERARRRRRQTPTTPRLPPEKMPPSVRRAALIRRDLSPLPRRPAEPTEPTEPEPSDEPEEGSRRVEAIEDARDATRSLADRLFGKLPAPDDPDADQEPEGGDDEGDAALVQPGAGELVDDLEITDTPQARPGTDPARPDPKLAARYRLDPEDYPILSRYGRNLTEAAALRRIDPVIGRDQEVTALIDILGKRRGNNPLLVGDAGVGKTAIVEGLAHTFVQMARRGLAAGERTIIELELGRLISGTHLRGSLSERLNAIKDEVRAAAGQVIVFLDEIHTWLGAGQRRRRRRRRGELKTALARGHFPCIGATTNDEFTRFIEADPAFERRFQLVDVTEPDIPTAIVIARGVREHYERHHGITYAEAAIEAAVRLSHRHLHDRRLPDKAIGVLDLAGSRAARESAGCVRREDIARIVAQMANLPTDRLTQSDRARFLDIERHLSRSVIGHEAVIHTVAEVLRRNYAGFRSQRPIGSLLFLGPTGVGKTELVKALADFLFHDRDAIVRLDMSEFMESHSVSRFIGAPPGYVGHDQGGQLTEAVRRRPYQVVLLDEIEKAHPDVLNLLLQLFDEGRLTDGRSRPVDFSNTLVVMTSNLGAEALDDHLDEESGRGRIGFGGSASAPSRADLDALGDQVRQAARAHFTPELWNRIDERLVFSPLRRGEVAQIAALQLRDSARRLDAESGIQMDFSEEVIGYLIRHGGYDRKFGARPMRQTIQRLIEGRLARLILAGELRRGEAVFIDIDEEDRLRFFARPSDEPG